MEHTKWFGDVHPLLLGDSGDLGDLTQETQVAAAQHRHGSSSVWHDHHGCVAVIVCAHHRMSRWRVADSEQQTADSGQQTADCGLRTVDCGQRTADSGLLSPRHCSRGALLSQNQRCLQEGCLPPCQNAMCLPDGCLPPRQKNLSLLRHKSSVFDAVSRVWETRPHVAIWRGRQVPRLPLEDHALGLGTR